MYLNLGILIPELVAMQARALFEASVSLLEKGNDTDVNIESLPLYAPFLNP
jgi:hypothetical protein